jgi:DNA-binding FadR family transcriptional regulator
MKQRTATVAREVKGPTLSHTGRVVSDLGVGIVSGKLSEGSLLPGDQELLAKYRVSRTVLREALKTLSAKGMVKAKARVGTRITPRDSWNLFDPDVLLWHAGAGFQPEFLSHLAEVRMALEPEAAALAAQRRTADGLAKINDWAERMSRPSISRADFVKADLGFHLAVAEAAANPFFISISTLVEVVLVAMLTISSPAEDEEALKISVAQHKRIAKAIADQKPDEARRAMQAVIQNGIDAARRRGGMLG